ncbi:hypothetical protein SERLA73DRAFT_139781 [Serpula lacrymans var. lacrymans S7.3]|uniref:Carbonic anhydrase n=1 Tax=Serpula lacrymans var. lacrymans (strain S7.3) TaxID=936435 RepID=F8Q2V6_SERL3|nr:hypothetical protein SERLA73DRAFT_139781 [Serpula lacrymans var. lacrymans S7.3]
MVDFVKANNTFVSQHSEKMHEVSKLGPPPSEHLIVLTCMDARLNPFKFLGLNEGEAHVIRNGGGYAKDALNSIILSQQFLQTRSIAVIHHTDCGMTHFTVPELRHKILETHVGKLSPDKASQVKKEYVELEERQAFRPFKDVDESVKEDVQFLKVNPMVKSEEGSITGWVYETESGKIRRVV